MRLGSANTYDSALQSLYARQSDMAIQQEKLTSGKEVNRPSDDPTGASQAERSLTRITRIATEQRALEVQRNSINMAESTLGDASGLAQSLRELIINAGNGGYTSINRTTLAEEMKGLRDQLFTLANRTDTNGVPLFGGLGSSSAPFTDAVAGVGFSGIAGQRASTETSIPSAMDGQAIWMNVPSGNGTFDVTLGGGNTGGVWTDPGQVTSPAAVTGHNYNVTFNVDSSVIPNVITYGIDDATTGAVIAPAASQPYIDGQAIQFDGLSFVTHGAPVNGDSIQLSPSTQTNIFKVIDDAIVGIDGAPSNNKLNQAIGLALTQLDIGMDRIQSARGQAGDWLNRADNIESTQNGRTVQLTADKSRAEDLEMVKGISDFQRFQTGYQAALQSYAQVQKLSLFNYIS